VADDGCPDFHYTFLFFFISNLQLIYVDFF